MWSQSEALIQSESMGEERKGHKMNSARGSFYRQILEYGTQYGKRQEPAETNGLSVSNLVKFVVLRRGHS